VSLLVNQTSTLKAKPVSHAQKDVLNALTLSSVLPVKKVSYVDFSVLLDLSMTILHINALRIANQRCLGW